MPLPHDPDFLEVASDVVVRFKGHGSYGSEAVALKALKRRAPGWTAEERLAVFEAFCRVYDRAVEAIDRHRLYRPDKQTGFAESADIDFSACLAELDEIEPGSAIGVKGQILNWVIFWHYLK